MDTCGGRTSASKSAFSGQSGHFPWQHRVASSGRMRLPASRAKLPYLAELLERRFLLAGNAVIQWVNRGNDGFDTYYKASAGLARGLVDHAIADWQQVIRNFNYADG